MCVLAAFFSLGVKERMCSEQLKSSSPLTLLKERAVNRTSINRRAAPPASPPCSSLHAVPAGRAGIATRAGARGASVIALFCPVECSARI